MVCVKFPQVQYIDHSQIVHVSDFILAAYGHSKYSCNTMYMFSRAYSSQT